MASLQGVGKTSAELLKMITRLAQQVRCKTTSEHLLDMRDSGPTTAAKPRLIKKSQSQLARESLSHMNCMPVPGGCWEDCYQARNMKRNRNLILSLSALGITIYCMFLTNCFFVHSPPPWTKAQIDKAKIGVLNLADAAE